MTRATTQARHATRVQFFCSGFLFATWGVHIPTVRQHYGIDETGLGIALLAAGIGTLAGLARAAPLLARFGPRRVAGVCGPLLAVSLGLVLAMPSYPALLGLMVAFGVANGLFDVAINTEAAELERRHAAPLMSGMHALFSVGGLAGAALGSALIAQSVRPVYQLAMVTMAMLLAIGLASWNLLPGGRVAPRAP